MSQRKQIEQELPVSGISAGVVSAEHAQAQIRVGGKGHHRLHVGEIGGQGNDTVFIGWMIADIVFRQPFEFGRIAHFHPVHILLYMLGKGERQLGCLIRKFPQVGAGGIVFIDAGQAVIQQRLVDIVRGAGVGETHVDGYQGAKHILVQGKGRCRLGYDLGQLPRFIAHRFVGIDAIQQRGQRARSA